MHGFESRPRYEEHNPVSSNGRARGCYPRDGGSTPPAGAGLEPLRPSYATHEQRGFLDCDDPLRWEA